VLNVNCRRHGSNTAPNFLLGSKFDIGINSSFEAAGKGLNELLADDGATAILTNSSITGHV